MYSHASQYLLRCISLWLSALLVALGALYGAGAQAASSAASATVPDTARDYAAVQFADADYTYAPPAPGESCCNTLNVLVKVTNTGERVLKAPVFEAQFFDASGKLIDAFVDETTFLSPRFHLSPGRDVMVRLSERARHNAQHYASVRVRLVSADWESPESDEETRFVYIPWRKWFAVWTPALLMMLVWAWRSRRHMAASGHYYRDLISCTQEQLATAQEHNRLLGRQIALLEQLVCDRPSTVASQSSDTNT